MCVWVCVECWCLGWRALGQGIYGLVRVDALGCGFRPGFVLRVSFVFRV